jgi:Holliday junction resolvase RusA-like endonuclease
MRVELTIPGVPIAQPRARATTAGGFTRMYTPSEKVAPFKEAIRILFAQAYQGPPSDKPCMVQITAVFPRAKSMIWKSKPMPRIPHTASSRNDVDNVCKSCLDALTKLAWRDDSQVYYAIVQKFIASGDEQPHTRIVISD